MRDFTLKAYKNYLEAIGRHTSNFLIFREFMSLEVVPASFCLLRHDVDRKPEHALRMAQLEANMGVRSTYYFRTKANIFIPSIIEAIANLGHEIGYHYESLSDTDGDMAMAIEDFNEHLDQMRKIVEVQTISMHGRPLKPYDNRDIWRDPERKRLLAERFDLLGEVYLDIDYSDIAYINDTGRNWMSTRSNRRDMVDSNISVDFESGESLLAYFQEQPHPKLVFSVHPERWSDELMDWSLQYLKDRGINLIKSVISLVGK